MMVDSNESTRAGFHGPVLVVDDSPDFRNAMLDVLTDAGRQVVLAENGEDALLKLSKTRPCLILLDLKMPVMDGFEFLDELAKLHLDIPVLAVSEHASLAPSERYPHLIGTLGKPFHIRDLLSIIDQYCSGRQPE